MDRPRRVFNVEPLAVALIFGCVAATLVTVIAVHRRPQATRPASIVVAASAPEVKVVEAPAPKPLPTPPPPKPAPDTKRLYPANTASTDPRPNALNPPHPLTTNTNPAAPQNTDSPYMLAIMRKRSFLNRRRGPGGKLVEFDPEVVEVAVG